MLRVTIKGGNFTGKQASIIAAIVGVWVLGMLALGTFAVDYSLQAIAGVDVPWFADLAIGFATGGAVFPVAIVVAILGACGVPTPFF